jgi:2-oxopent-4-enoate hydratase
MEPETSDSLAAELDEALQTGTPIAPITDRHDVSIEDAYEIQDAFVEKRIERGQSIVGHKIGLTNEGIQDQLGVTEPDFGRVLDGMVVSDRHIPAEDLIAPRIEPEIGFVLDEELEPPVNPLDVLSATRAVLPVAEVIDSRVADWNIQIEDTIADNASSALIVPGESLSAETDIDLSMEGVKLFKNGILESAGIGANVLEHPSKAVAWLANTIGQMGDSLEAGELVLSGSFVPATDIEPGDVIELRFTTLGSATMYVE